jgi:hypothetical protein
MKRARHRAKIRSARTAKKPDYGRGLCSEPTCDREFVKKAGRHAYCERCRKRRAEDKLAKFHMVAQRRTLDRVLKREEGLWLRKVSELLGKPVEELTERDLRRAEGLISKKRRQSK